MANFDKIIIGSDHIGLPLKNVLVEYLLQKKFIVKDIGVNTSEPVNYPEIAMSLAGYIRNGFFTRGILVCGTGIGMAIAANKVRGVRAAVIHDSYSAERAIASNNAQIAAFGSQVIGINSAQKNLDIWLENEYIPGGRSQPKVDLLIAMDEM